MTNIWEENPDWKDILSFIGNKEFTYEALSDDTTYFRNATIKITLKDKTLRLFPLQKNKIDFKIIETVLKNLKVLQTGNYTKGFKMTVDELDAWARLRFFAEKNKYEQKLQPSNKDIKNFFEILNKGNLKELGEATKPITTSQPTQTNNPTIPIIKR